MPYFGTFLIVCYASEALITNVRHCHLSSIYVIIQALIYHPQSHNLSQSGFFSKWYKLPPNQNFYVKMIARTSEFRNQLTIGKLGILSMELYSNVSIIFKILNFTLMYKFLKDYE